MTSCSNQFLRLVTCSFLFFFQDIDWLQGAEFGLFYLETLEQRHAKQLAVCIYKSINNLFLIGLKSLFEPISQVHVYKLRGSSNNIFIRRPETDAARKSFSY